MATTTETRDQAATSRAVDRLTETIAMLTQAADDMTALANDPNTGVRCATQIATFARDAADTADLALMVARNEQKLAQRDQ